MRGLDYEAVREEVSCSKTLWTEGVVGLVSEGRKVAVLGHDFVEDLDRLGERLLVVAEGEEECFYYIIV